MMSKPKVLMCIDWYLPGYRAGGPIRSCANLVAHLQHEVDFYILCGDKDYQSDEVYDGIVHEQWSKGTLGEKVMYVEPARMTKSFIREVITESEFDGLYIHGLFSKHFSIAPLRAANGLNIRMFIAPRGMLRESAISMKGQKKRVFLKLAKVMGWYKGVAFHATDKQEESDIRHWIDSDAVVRRAPNLPRNMPASSVSVDKEIGELKLIFAGRIAPEKNLEYALEVLSELKESRIRLDIYGATYDRAYLDRCNELVESLPVNVSVRFHEPIPSEDVVELLSKYHALFLPTRGENFGHIILESLMASRPVLISDQTPWKNLEQENAGFSIALDSPRLFAERISEWAMMDQTDYDVLCQKSFEKAERFCNDPELIAASKALFLPT